MGFRIILGAADGAQFQKCSHWMFLDSCKKTAVVVDDLIAGLEFVNCQSVQAQV